MLYFFKFKGCCVSLIFARKQILLCFLGEQTFDCRIPLKVNGFTGQQAVQELLSDVQNTHNHDDIFVITGIDVNVHGATHQFFD